MTGELWEHFLGLRGWQAPWFTFSHDFDNVNGSMVFVPSLVNHLSELWIPNPGHPRLTH